MSYQITIDGLLSEFEGGESLLLDLGVQRYHRLNGTAAFLWNEMERRVHDQASLAHALALRYDLEETRARASVSRFITELLDLGLIAETPPGLPLSARGRAAPR